MSIAHLNSARAARTNHFVRNNTTTITNPPATNGAINALSAVPAATQARGFAFYVGIDEAQAALAGTSLSAIVAALRETLESFAPGLAAESYAAVALAPIGLAGRNIDIVRNALREPKAVRSAAGSASASTDVAPDAATGQGAARGIVIDFSRLRVFVDGHNAQLTGKEFDLLAHLVSHPGETFSRDQIVEQVWAADSVEAPNDRTVDVHIRRLRAKIAGYEDVIRTIRGTGYRFDKHPDVLLEGI